MTLRFIDCQELCSAVLRCKAGTSGGRASWIRIEKKSIRRATRFANSSSASRRYTMRVKKKDIGDHPVKAGNAITRSNQKAARGLWKKHEAGFAHRSFTCPVFLSSFFRTFFTYVQCLHDSHSLSNQGAVHCSFKIDWESRTWLGERNRCGFVHWKTTRLYCSRREFV